MEFIKGTERTQLTLFHECLDNIIDDNHPVRFIDHYVDTLDNKEMGIKIPKLETGRPSYNPKMLLKIYIYCYMEKIRSSRCMEKECNRNQELIWLTENLAPDFKTLADFRKNNKKALHNLFKELLQRCNNAGLLSLTITATDGTKLKGQNSKNEVYHRKTVDKVKERIESKIEDYMRLLEENDKQDELELNEIEVAKINKRLNKLMSRKEKLAIIKTIFEENPEVEKQFVTDPESRFMNDKGQVVVGYNAQISVDNDSKLIVACDVTNQSNDWNQMNPMVQKLEETKKELGIDGKTKVLMDAGYDNEAAIIAQQDNEKIEVFVQSKEEAGRQKRERGLAPSKKRKTDKVPSDKFHASKFFYSSEDDTFICPEGKKLLRTNRKETTEASGRKVITYACKDYKNCKSCCWCTKSKQGRILSVSLTHEKMKEYHDSMKSEENKKLLERRKEIVEHPFGTIKKNWGFSGFLQRGLDNAKAEFSFICFIYNFKRIMNIFNEFSIKKLIETM